MRVSPLVGMTAALLAGILAAPFLSTVPVAVAITVSVLAFVGAIGFRQSPVIALSCYLVPFAVWGTMLAQQRGTPAPNDVSRLSGQPSFWIAGTVAAEPEAQATGNIRYPLHATAREDGTELSGTLLVTQTPNAGPAPHFGDSVVVRGLVERPPTATNPGGFDYRAFLRRKSIFATLIAKRTGDARTVTSGNDRSLTALAMRVHRSLLAALSRSPLPKDEKALVAGVLLSEREGIAYENNLAFERTGAVHILSVSGLHLAVFATVLSFLSRRLPVNRGLRNGANLLAILLLWTFALASGLSTATVRSAVMLSLILLAPVLRRDADPLHALVVAAFVILIVDPLAVYDVGFQLSLACVGGILLWINPLEHWLFPLEYHMSPLVRFGRGISFLGLTGFVAQVAALPSTAYHFSLVSMIAPLAGIVLVPLSELLLMSALAVTGASVCGPLPVVVWMPVHALCAGLIRATQFFAAPELAAVSVPAPNLPGVVLFYILFAGLGLTFRRVALRRTFRPETEPRRTDRQLAAFPLAAMLGLPLLLVVLPAIVTTAQERRELRVTFLDVGQGDATVIEAPDGAVAVIDAGGYPGTDERYVGDPGSRIVVPYLRRRGINRVDWLVPSHPDEDHVQGLIAVTRAFPVGNVLDGGVPDDGGASARLRELLRQKRIPFTRAQRGQVIPLGTSGATLEVLHPTQPLLTNTRSVTNANSIVLRLRYKNATMLFTGDAEEAAESSLLQSGVALHADVLKVGHHGSRFSSGPPFLTAVSPTAAVIPVGKENNFGHPAPNVLANLESVGATTYRTDRQGAIVIMTDGRGVSVMPTLR